MLKMAMKNPFVGQIQKAIPEKLGTFLMLYYLPTGQNAGSITTTGNTYYIAWATPSGDSATFGVLNYTSKTKGRPFGMYYEKVANGFQFQGNTIINYASATSSFSSDNYNLNEKALPHLDGSTSWTIAKTDNPTADKATTFQLSQVNTNLATDEIYAGVWYTMEANGNKVLPPVYDLPPKVGSYPFPQQDQQTISLNNNSILSEPYVMFLPYTLLMSYWTGNTCQPAGYNTGMLMVNDWILTAHSKLNNSKTNAAFQSSFTQKQCYGKLSHNSKYCAYMGTACNGGLGFNYCGLNQTCGKCFGVCSGKKKGLSCTWDSNKGTSDTFYCTSQQGAGADRDPGAGTQTGKPNATKKAGGWTMAIVISIVVGLILLLMSFYLIGHHMHHGAKGAHAKHSASSSSNPFSSSGLNTLSLT